MRGNAHLTRLGEGAAADLLACLPGSCFAPAAECLAGFPIFSGEHPERASSRLRLPGSMETTDRGKG